MLVRWTPFRELSSLQDEMNQVFDSFARRSRPATAEAAWSPATDVYEDEGNFVLHMELPGLSKDDVELHLENRTLTVRGERKMAKDVRKENYHLVERLFGRFSRSFTLPSTVDQDKIQARFHNGVLEVVLPKAEEVRPRRIDVSGE